MNDERQKQDAYAALRLRNFRLRVIGRFIAILGELMVQVAIGWELYQRTGDALALGLIGLVQIIPVFLLALPAGYIVDRYNRKRVLLLSLLVMAAAVLILGIVSAAQGALVLVYFALALMGVAQAFWGPADGALIPLLVPPPLYRNATTWSSSSWQLASITGPALGGAIIAATNSATPVYLLATGGFLFYALLMLFVRPAPQTFSEQAETPAQALRTGIRFLRSNRLILSAITLDMFAVLLGGAVFLLPIFAEDILRVDAVGLGWLRAGPSIGAIVASLAIANMPPFQRAGQTLLWVVAGFGLATIVFGISTNFWLSFAMLVLLGGLDGVSVVIRGTLLLTQTPDEMRGRVSAVNSIFIGASNELGGFESGVAAWLLGPVGAVVFGGIGTLLVVLAVAWWSPELRRLARL
ncbi:MAG: MFS transporter [Chloroflexota bacterium]|nr:MFS transporter [Chloroflexota bacterium]